MFVKPNPNKKVDGAKLEVYDPAHRNFLPEEGRDVPNNAYWVRRLQAGDVIRANQETETKSEEPEAPKAKSATKAKKASSKKGK